MCGLFGWSVTKTGNKLSTAARVLAVLNDQRGGHSFGAWREKSGILKGLGHMSQAVGQIEQFKNIMAHTRFATVGEISKANAHPFHIGDYIGAHNGAVYNYREMNEKYGRKFDVDSPHIFAHLAEGKPLDELTGYGAVSFRKAGEDKTYIATVTRSGSLHAARCSIGVFYSSAKDHLTQAITAMGENAEFVAMKDLLAYSVHDGEIYTTEWKLELGARQSWNVGGERISQPYFQHWQGSAWDIDHPTPRSRRKRQRDTKPTPVVPTPSTTLVVKEQTVKCADPGAECGICHELFFPTASMMLDACDNCVSKYAG